MPNNAGVGEMFIKTGIDAGLYVCLEAEHWTLLATANNAGLATGSLVDGAIWAEASGASPSRTVTLYVRDGGINVELLT